jgi:hypothetical protein
MMAPPTTYGRADDVELSAGVLVGMGRLKVRDLWMPTGLDVCARIGAVEIPKEPTATAIRSIDLVI